ncbi:hypothetical protein ABAC460_18075 [Asticcacaulis sp. AC460]|uniref:ATP-binding protein n=1 Tax=Asticcacaulis sp. AC460 TaxID=1282360 RepID=UPI0003C40E49|nr:ATP-binding protein [Asticcacaulis sp. AC460]ESQ87836.1 hypothetical protein ABAC460_18075 [Asticcacaulis sp. AC460]
MTVKTILLSVLATLAALLILALSVLLVQGVDRFQDAARAERSNQITASLLTASGHWAEERGFTNLALNAPNAAGTDVIAHIHALRTQADADYFAALNRLPQADIAANPRFSQQFDAAYARLKALRAQVDQELKLPRSARDPALLAAWFPAASAVIEQSQLSGIHYSSQTLNTTSVIAKDAIVRHNLWMMSEYAGRERGLLAGIISAGRPITPEQMNTLSEYRAHVQDGWNVVAHLQLRADEQAMLSGQMAQVRTGFFEDYETLRLRILAQGRAGEAYSLTAQEWFDQSTAAISLILDLEKGNALYVESRVQQQKRSEAGLLALCIFGLIAGVAAVAAAFWLVNRHVLYTMSNLNAIFDNATDGLITIDARGTIKSFNPACEAMFQRQARDVRGQNISILMPEPFHGEHVAREVTGLRKTGEVFPMELSVTRFELDDGVHFCGVLRDITKARMAEKDRQSLLEKLTESNTELERFAYAASHDMQEPIRMVMSFSQMVVQDYEARLDDKGREYLLVLSDSAHRLHTMVRELLQYARLGREGLTYGEVDLSDQLDHVKVNLSELIKDSGALISHDAMPHVRGNAVQLLRLLQNLISNAIKYQPQGRRPQVHVTVEERESDWLFGVRDNGLGIDEAYRQVIFEPFKRLHTHAHIKGVGFGLSICRKIVENHDGRIWVESAPDGGSIFYFTVSKIAPANRPAG